MMLVFSGTFSFAQNQRVADSLILLYNSGSYQIDELDLLSKIASNETNGETSLQYAEALINKAARDSVFEYLYKGHLHKGNALGSIGKNVMALESFFQAEKYAIRTGDQKNMGSALISIAGTYANTDNYVNAKYYYNESINLLRTLKDSIGIAKALANLGDLYINENKLDSALIYTREAASIFNMIDHTTGKAYSMGNTGMIYAKQGNDKMAEIYLREPIEILEELEDYYRVCVYLTYMSDIFLRKGDWNKALGLAQSILDMAEANELTEQISDAHLKLADLYEYKGNFEESNEHLKSYYSFRDSIRNIEVVSEMANLRTDFELSQKQIEVDLLNEQKGKQRIIVTSSIVALVLIVLYALGLLHRNRYIQKTSHIIKGERDRSDNLLCNILPEKTAQELKEVGKVQAKHFESVTVMFTDFKAFTANSDQLSPEELVESIDFYFSRFDEIMEKYGLEKIKTIGDAYMCAGGLPFATPDHAHKMVEAAFEIAEFVNEAKKEDPNNLTRFDIRIGINTGPVVAGVVGTKKFAYDIWGDTVNIASRMESNSESGKINISENTYQLIKEDFYCSYRGEIEAKHRGKLKMYFVNSQSGEHNLKESSIRTIRMDDYTMKA
jgi:class 3 adenylate cyclase